MLFVPFFLIINLFRQRNLLLDVEFGHSNKCASHHNIIDHKKITYLTHTKRFVPFFFSGYHNLKTLLLAHLLARVLKVNL